jgi:predicted enzyme related to lactoylglutathione lyase
MSIKDVAIVSVPVKDAQRAKNFYVDKLGFKVTAEVIDAMGPGKSWITVQPKAGGASLTLVTWFETMPAGSLRGLVLTTEDLDAEHARLKKAGVDIGEVRSESWGRFTTLRDSEGNDLVLQQARS